MTHYHKTPNKPGTYTITCQRTGKYYIGSSNKLRVRRNRHLNDLRGFGHYCIGLQKLFNLHPHTLVFTYHVCDSPKAARDEEYFLIKNNWVKGKVSGKLLNSASDAYASGKGIKKTKEQREAQSKRMMGNEVTPETRAKISQSLMGVPLDEKRAAIVRTVRLGATNSEEHNERIRISLTNKPKSDTHIASLKEAKPNPVVIDNIEYFNPTRAAEALGLHRGTVNKRLRNKNYPNYYFKRNNHAVTE